MQVLKEHRHAVKGRFFYLQKGKVYYGTQLIMKWNLNQRIKIEPQHLNIYSCTCIHVRCIIILVLYMACSCLNVVDNSIICLICIYLHQHNLVFEIYWLCLWGKEGETTQTMKSTSQTWHWCVSWWMMQVHLVEQMIVKKIFLAFHTLYSIL